MLIDIYVKFRVDSLLLIDNYMKFHEDSLYGFQVIEWTPFCDGQSFKGNNSKNINASYSFCVLHVV